MSKDTDDLLKQFVAGDLSEAEIEPQLAPGCRLDSKTETESRFPPNKPVEHWKRSCTRTTDCDDPSNNSGWVCRPWEFDY